MNRLSKIHRHVLFWTIGTLLVTGTVWALLHYLPGAIGAGEDAARAAAVWVMKLHGAAAMLGLLMLGSLLPLHIKTGWQTRLNTKSGVGMLLSAFLLVATGWILYYAGSESVRKAGSLVHLLLGFVLPILLPVHLARFAARQQVESITRGLP